jgi:glycosyltransferase involved in cell wall biosynthesis
MKQTKKIIAFCGTRGVPASYGGFETAVDEISRRFVAAGYPVEVFCRSSHAEQQITEDEDRQLVFVPGARSNTLETIASSIQTGCHLWRNRRQYRHVFWFNNANFPGIMMSLLAGLATTVNMDGLEWRRKKWKAPFKAYYVVSSFLISRFCRRLVSDSHGIQDYYRRLFNRETFFIPYGVPPQAEVSRTKTQDVLSQYGLESGRYFLQVTRFEPDNLPLEVAQAFIQAAMSEKGFQYVIVGYKSPTPYAQQLKALDGQGGVRVLPAVYDAEVLAALRANSFCYLHGNSVGGTNPALLEAMSTCSRVLAIDIEFSHEVLGDTGVFFTQGLLQQALLEAIHLPDCGAVLRERVQSLYQWDAVADAYMRIVEGEIPNYRPS